LTIEDVLERRLQTIVFRKGLSKTIHQARQLISHGHVAIGDRRVTIPSYFVTKEEENRIAYAPRSSLADASHPIHQTISVAAKTQTRPGEAQTEE